MSLRAFGWIPSSNLESEEGHLHIENRSIKLSSKLELDMAPVYDQGNIGSCTANAIANIIRYEKKKSQTVMNRVECFYTTWLERIKA
jgi:hypothetical protein